MSDIASEAATISSDALITYGLFMVVVHVVGVLSAVQAVLTTRTPQGAIAWSAFLIGLPLISLPAYWIFGRNRFHGYVQARQGNERQVEQLVRQLEPQLACFRDDPGGGRRQLDSLNALAELPFTEGNRAELLIDGEATFAAIFEAIGQAESYILVQFYIVRDDEVGRALRDHLCAAAKRGVEVGFLYDEIGSHALPESFGESLRSAGGQVRPFNTTKGRRNRFQLNFRNHRKIVVVDGRTAFVGGHNVGLEYLGRDPKFGAWRDTHVKVEGPAVLGIQLAFAEDWYWATSSLPPVAWTPAPGTPDGSRALTLATGPADRFDTCRLAFVELINAARERLWIVSPYFVPDIDVMSALKLAAFRGVDVRLILPEKPDHLLVYLAAYAYFDDIDEAGIKNYRYRHGFMHQKVWLVDDEIAVVGTANMDNRSFRLNFEISMIFVDKPFAARVEEMLERDLERSTLLTRADVAAKPAWFPYATRAANLMAPIL